MDIHTLSAHAGLVRDARNHLHALSDSDPSILDHMDAIAALLAATLPPEAPDAAR